MGIRGLGAYIPVHRQQILLCALCAAFALLSGVYLARSLLKPDTGLVVSYPEAVVEEGRVLFSPKAPFSAAVAAGLLPGRDEILSVNGRPVASSRDLIRADASVRGFDPFPVEILRDGMDRRTLFITPVLTPTRPDWIFVLLFCVVLLTTAVLLSVRQPDAPGTVALVMASLFYLVFTCVKPFYYESLTANILIHLGKLTPWLLVAFGLSFPAPRGSRAMRVAVIAALFTAYGVFFAARIGLYARWASEGAEALLERYRQLGRIGNAAEGVSYLAWGSLMASAYLRAPTQKEKLQLRWILAGILVALPPYFFLDQLPLIVRQPGLRMSLGNLAQLFLSFIPVCTLIGLTRHRLFSLRFFLSRVILAAAMLVAIALLFAFLYAPLGELVATGYRLSSPLVEIIATAIILAALVPVRWALVRAVDLIVAGSRRASVVDLERRNAELELLMEELGRQSARVQQGRRLADLRAVLRGVVRALRGPVREVAAGLTAAREALGGRVTATARDDAEAGIARGLGAGVRIGDVLRALESLGGSSVVSQASTRLDMLVKSAVELTLARHPGARIEADLGCEGRLACFPEELLRALCDVLDNAVEAQEGRAEPVHLRLAQERARAIIEIDDTGPGLGPQARRLLFSPFHSTKEGHQGLGLYFARIVVERNDGSIEVGPGIEGGTRVRLVFPLETEMRLRRQGNAPSAPGGGGMSEEMRAPGARRVEIWADGGCLGNPGPGGWAFVLRAPGQRVVRSGFEPQTTNNRMELTAVTEGLREAVARPELRGMPLTVTTDSQYVQKGITQWIHSWVKNGWKTTGKSPVKNVDLWSALWELSRDLPVTWLWVMGHAGDEMNEVCHGLVEQAVKGGLKRPD